MYMYAFIRLCRLPLYCFFSFSSLTPFSWTFVQSKVSYNDQLSGESSDEHDAYLVRMKAEGEQASSEEEGERGKES